MYEIVQKGKFDQRFPFQLQYLHDHDQCGVYQRQWELTTKWTYQEHLTTGSTASGVKSDSIQRDISTSKLSVIPFGNKVITTMVIRPLDDPIWCAQSVVADLRLRLGVRGSRGLAILIARPCIPISLTHMVYLLKFVSYLDTMTSTTLEAIASFSGKIVQQ